MSQQRMDEIEGEDRLNKAAIIKWICENHGRQEHFLSWMGGGDEGREVWNTGEGKSRA